MTAEPTGPRGSATGSAFRVVGERLAWEGRRIRVILREIAGPGDERLEREVVQHPGAVGVVPLHDDGTLTLVRQYRPALDAAIWEIPAGLRDVEGEPTERTAGRELIEEAGLRADHLRELVMFNNSPGFTDESVTVYLATGLTPVPDDRQSIEEQHMEVVRLPLAEALAMVSDGRITDAKTVIGLLLTARAIGGDTPDRRSK